MDMKNVDRYRPECEIGEGGYGKVWMACDTLSGERVAVKIYKTSFSDKSIESAKREYELGSGLNHPNILGLKDLICKNGTLWLVMPYCPAGSIARLSGSVDETTIWKIVKDVARGMEYLHSRGILHLDIKPANILQDAAGNYVLADFGISQRISEYVYQDDIDRTILYSRYMAPERRNRTWSIDTYSDVWSFGIMLQELMGEIGPFVPPAENKMSLGLYSGYLHELARACTLEHPELRPSATTILRVAEDVPIFCHDGCSSVIHINDNPPDMAGEPQLIRRPRRGHRALPAPRLSGFRREYSETILAAMKRYKVVRDADNMYGIVDEAGNVVVDFEYDEIFSFGECEMPGPGPLSVFSFVGAYFVQNEKIGAFRILDDGSLREDWKGTWEEYEMRDLWT